MTRYIDGPIYRAFVQNDPTAHEQVLKSGLNEAEFQQVRYTVLTYQSFSKSRGILASILYIAYRVVQTVKAIFGCSDWQKAKYILDQHAVIVIGFDLNVYFHGFYSRHGAGLLHVVSRIDQGVTTKILEACVYRRRLNENDLKFFSFFDDAIRNFESQARPSLHTRIKRIATYNYELPTHGIDCQPNFHKRYTKIWKHWPKNTTRAPSRKWIVALQKQALADHQNSRHVHYNS